MSSQDLYDKMKTLWEQFEAGHNATTKKGKANARKAIGELKKLVTDYRKQSVNESKN